MNWIIKLIITSILVVVISHFLAGVYVENFVTALLVAIVLGFLNVFFKPLLIFLTIPVTILTLGFFLLIINALIIIAADTIVDGFTVDGFWSAFIFSLILSICQSFLNKLLIEEKKS